MPIIEVEHLQKRYGDTVAVSDVSFSIEEGRSSVFSAPTALGRPPRSRCVAGLRKPDAGRMLRDGARPVGAIGEKLRSGRGGAVAGERAAGQDARWARRSSCTPPSIHSPADWPQRLLETLGPCRASARRSFRETVGRAEATAVDRAGADRHPGASPMLDELTTAWTRRPVATPGTLIDEHPRPRA